MQAGKLDRRITLTRYGISYDSDNQPIEAWTTLATVSASWRRASARETLAGAEISAAATDIFETHYIDALATLNPKDRLTYQGDDYNVVRVDEVGRRVGLHIEATKRADTYTPPVTP